jgi:hypothetical protein
VKFGTLIRVVVFLAVFGWAGYTAFMIAYDYFDTSGMVGQLVVDSVTKRKAMVGAGGSPAVTQDIAKDVRGLILKESRRQQIALDEGSLQVTPGLVRSAGLDELEAPDRPLRGQESLRSHALDGPHVRDRLLSPRPALAHEFLRGKKLDGACPFNHRNFRRAAPRAASCPPAFLQILEPASDSW